MRLWSLGTMHVMYVVPAAKVFADSLYGIDVGSVAGKNPRSYRQPVGGDRRGDHDLQSPVSLLGVSEFSQAILACVFVINMKGCLRSVVIDEVHVAVEQARRRENWSLDPRYN